nr:hypothetical protein [uncultured Acetatifactor sp.]
MNTQDITMEQLETLVLIRSLEEFVTDEHENLSSLSEVIWTLEESLSNEEHEQLVADICKLTEKGYLLSDGTEEHIEIDRIPEVEGITPKGQSALNEWEKEIRGSIDRGNKQDIVIVKNYNFLCGLKINVSLLNISNSLFSALDFGNRIKEMLHI